MSSSLKYPTYGAYYDPEADIFWFKNGERINGRQMKEVLDYFDRTKAKETEEKNEVDATPDDSRLARFAADVLDCYIRRRKSGGLTPDSVRCTDPDCPAHKAH